MSNGTVLQWPDEGSDSPTLPARKFRLGAFQVDPMGLLIRNGLRSEHVERKVMEVLVCLARRGPGPVTREQLFDEAWQGAYVTEGVLNRVISILRKALDDNPRAPEYIETIPRVGYRLLQPVEWEEAQQVVPAGGIERKPRRATLGAIAMAGAVTAVTIGFLLRPSIEAPKPVLRPLTTNPGWEIMPAIAPNGRWVAYVGIDKEENGGIYLSTRDVGTPPRLFVANADGRFPYAPTWSPDGTELAWHEAGTDGQCAIATRSLVAEDTERRFRCTSANRLDWSPDGRFLLITQGRAGGPPAPVVELNLETGEQTVAVAATETQQDIEAKYSPDGDRIATARVHVGQTISAAVFDRRGQLLTEFRPAKGTVQSLDWLGPNELLMSYNDGSGLADLWRYELSTERFTRIAETRGARSPSVAAGTVVLSRSSVRSRIWTVSSSSIDTPQVVVESTQLDHSPGLSPNGEDVAFVSNRSGTTQVWLQSGEGTAVQVTDLESDWIGPPQWSTDGGAFLFEVHSGAGFAAYTFDVATRRVEAVDLPFDNVRGPLWAPDGEIIVSVEQGANWQLWSDGGNGNWQQITNKGGYVARFSPAGDTIYYTKFNRPGLWRSGWPAADLSATEVQSISWLEYADRRNWAVVEDGVVARRAVSDADCELALVGSGGTQTLDSFSDVFLRGVDARRSTVVYSGFENLGSDLYELELSKEAGG